MITHTLVPPTPGPLLMAATLGIDLGTMIVVGTLVGLPAAVVGLAACHVMNRLMDVPMRPYAGQTEAEPLADSQLPPLWASLLPVVLPVVLISANTVAGTVAKADPTWTGVADVTALLGNANFALLLSAAIAMVMLVRTRHLSLAQLGLATESALISAGVIILITAAGGAFGRMLRETGLNESIMRWVGTEGQTTGTVMLLLAFTISVVMKIAQGSGTVAMITTSAMIAAMGIPPEMLGFHPVYLATAIGGGSMTGSWMNDSGFWVYARMGNVTETEVAAVVDRRAGGDRIDDPRRDHARRPALSDGVNGHQRFRTSTKCPATAAAAAMAGETRWVRPPLPCRPSKLRLLVAAQRSPGSSLSGFIARHMLQPGSRHSRPASVKIRSSPSASAWRLTSPLPGTTIALTPSATLVAADHGGRGPQILDPPVGAGADEHAVDADRRDRRARLSGPCTPAPPAAALLVGRVGEVGRIGHRAGHGDDLAGVGAPGDLRLDRRRRRTLSTRS